MIDVTKKINFLSALLSVDRSKENESWIDSERMARGLGIDDYYGSQPDDLQERVKAYHLKVWNCTDTWVGIEAIYFDGQCMGYSTQESRKGGIDFIWLSKEKAEKLRSYLIQAFDYDTLSYLEDTTGTIDEYSRFSYRDSVVEDNGVYDGQPVTLDRKATYELWHNTEPGSYERLLFDKLVVVDAQGMPWTIKAEDFYVRLRLNTPVVNQE